VAEPGTVNRERQTDNSVRGRTQGPARRRRARNGNRDSNTNSRCNRSCSHRGSRSGTRNGIRHGYKDGTKLGLKMLNCRGRRRLGRWLRRVFSFYLCGLVSW